MYTENTQATSYELLEKFYQPTVEFQSAWEELNESSRVGILILAALNLGLEEPLTTDQVCMLFSYIRADLHDALAVLHGAPAMSNAIQTLIETLRSDQL